MSNILCEKPKYILNPAFKQAVLQTGKFVYNGDEEFVPEMRLAAWRWSFPYARFSPKGIDFENLASWQDSYYTTDLMVILYRCFWRFRVESVLCVENVMPVNGCFALLQRLNIAARYLIL